MKSRAFLIASVVSAAVFAMLLCAGIALHCTGPVRLSKSLQVDSGYGYWLVFFDSGSEEEPYFSGILLLVGDDGAATIDGLVTHPVIDKRWVLWGYMGALNERYVDANGLTHLTNSYYMLPGIFYRHHQWIDYRLLTLALGAWLLLGVPLILPGLWLFLRVRKAVRARKIGADARPTDVAGRDDEDRRTQTQVEAERRRDWLREYQQHLF